MKQRVYKKNKDVLIQLERSERVDKVEETVGEVSGDYERLLRGLEGSEKHGNGNGDASGSVERRERAKRKVIVDEEDVEDNESEEQRGQKGVKRRKDADG